MFNYYPYEMNNVRQQIPTHPHLWTLPGATGY